MHQAAPPPASTSLTPCGAPPPAGRPQAPAHSAASTASRLSAPPSPPPQSSAGPLRRSGEVRMRPPPVGRRAKCGSFSFLPVGRRPPPRPPLTGLLLQVLEPEELHLLRAPSFRPPVSSSAARGRGRRGCAAGNRRPPADLRRAAGVCPELLSSVRGGVNAVGRVAFLLLLPRGWRVILEGYRRSRGSCNFWLRGSGNAPESAYHGSFS
jgi:hypothetical protein